MFHQSKIIPPLRFRSLQAELGALQVELPDRLAELLQEMVQEGWFQSEEEAVRAALEFLRRHPRQLAERFQVEDIEWAQQLRQSRDSWSATQVRFSTFLR